MAKFSSEIHHMKHPRSFIRCLSPDTISTLRASWRPTAEFDDFDAVLDFCTSDVVARRQEAMASPAAPLEPPVDPTVREKLEQDLFALVLEAQGLYHDKGATVIDMAVRTATATFDAAIARLTNPPVYIPLVSPFSHKPIRVQEDLVDPKVEPREDDPSADTPPGEDIGCEPPQVNDIRDVLLAEAEHLYPALALAMLPSLDVGRRVQSIQKRRLYGVVAKHRLALDRLMHDVEDANPSVEAPGYIQIPEAVVISRVRDICLAGFEGARPLYRSFIETDNSLPNILERLRNLPHDHDDTVVVPWRAYAVMDSQRPQRDSNPGQQGQNNSGGSGGRGRKCGRSGDSSSDNTQSGNGQSAGGDSTGQSSGDSTSGGSNSQPRKPLARRVDGPDPYVQLKDPEHYYIHPSFKHFCATHGYNSSHVTSDCREAKGNGSAPKTGAPEADTNAEKGDEKGKTRWLRRNGRLESNNVEHVTPGGHLITVPLVFQGVTLDAIVDPGATTSCMSEEALNRLAPEAVKLAKGGAIRGADQNNISAGSLATSSMVVKGLTAYPLTLEWTFHVIKGGEAKVLLGADLLWHLGLMTPKGIFVRLHPQEGEAEDAGIPDHEYLHLDNRTKEEEGQVNHIDNNGDLFGVTVDPDFPLKKRLEDIVRDHPAVFGPLSSEGADLPPATIKLVENASLPCAKPRPLRPAVLMEVHRQLDELDERGIVRDSESPVASAVVIAHKGESEIRLCCDYRGLNDVTVPDRFPLADIRTFLQDLAGSQYYFVCDLRSGYHQLPMAEEDVPLTAIITPGRFKEYLFAPFGLRNLPSQFQRAIQQVLQPLTRDGTRNYIDDILGRGTSPADLCEKFDRLCCLLERKRLRLKGEKCHLGATRVEILGVIVDRDGQRIAPQRAEAILRLHIPINKGDMRTIIGIFSFVATFIPDAQSRLKPFHLLVNAEDPVTEDSWTDEHQQALDELKALAASDVCLVHPRLDRTWRLETDASLVGIGGVLHQRLEDGTWGVVAFFSHAFNDTQTRWCTYDQELFAIVYCLSRPHMAPLFKAHTDLEIHTDHKNLVYLHTRATDNRKHLRWLLLMQEYTFTIHHISGKDNALADALSRYWPAPEADVNQVTDEPLPEDQRADAIADAHRYHEGVDATLRNLLAHYPGWEGARAAVADHVHDCLYCNKTRLSAFIATADQSTLRGHPFQTIAIDTMGPFPVDTEGNRYIVVATDMFSRYTELIPSPSNNAVSTARALWSIIGRHGIPVEILSDRGPEYANRVVDSLLERLQVSHHKTIPFHPQSNGLAERRNQEVKRHLRVLCLMFDLFTNWSAAVPYVMYILNTTKHSATGFEPMSVLFGAHAIGRRFAIADGEAAAPHTVLDDTTEYVTELTRHLTTIADQARQHQAQSHEELSDIQLEPGSLVLRRNERPTKLHGHRGPLKVVSVDGYDVEVAPLVLSPEDSIPTRHVHASQLIPVSGGLADEELLRVAATDEEEFFVESIDAIEGDMVLVKWVGFDERTWEHIDSPAAQTDRARQCLEALEGGGSVAGL